MSSLERFFVFILAVIIGLFTMEVIHRRRYTKIKKNSEQKVDSIISIPLKSEDGENTYNFLDFVLKKTENSDAILGFHEFTLETLNTSIKFMKDKAIYPRKKYSQESINAVLEDIYSMISSTKLVQKYDQKTISATKMALREAIDFNVLEGISESKH